MSTRKTDSLSAAIPLTFFSRLMASKAAFALCAGVLFFALALGAQDTFVVDTKLVIVNVTVKDKAGRLVTNLKKEDFQVLEDGVPQKIAVFDKQELSAEPMAPLSFTTRPQTLEERAAAATAPAGASVNTQSARDPKRYQNKRLIGLFFDMSSMDVLEQARAEDAAIKFLQSQMTAADMVSIMTFSSKFKTVVDFTDDRESLIAVLRKFATGEGADLAGMASTTADEGDDSGSFAADDTEFNIFNTDRKLTALEDAARKLAVFP